MASFYSCPESYTLPPSTSSGSPEHLLTQFVILAALLPPLCWPPRGNSRAGWFLSHGRTRNEAEWILASLGFTLQDVSVLDSCLQCVLIGYMIRLG